MKAEISAGSSYVIAEARESGNVGIYRGSSEVREGIECRKYYTVIPEEKIILGRPPKIPAIIFYRISWRQR